MKALTLTQPWASLVAAGVKTIETRSWKTNYRGPLAIHAGLKWPPLGPIGDFAVRTLGPDPVIHKAASPLITRSLPLGFVIATCELVSVRPTESLSGDAFMGWDLLRNRDFGDFAPGRYAWLLRDARPMDEPIPVKGALGLWEWENEPVKGFDV